MPNSCPINVGERLRIVAPVPLIKKPEIQRKLAPDYESGGQEFESLRARQVNQWFKARPTRPRQLRVTTGVTANGIHASVEQPAATEPRRDVGKPVRINPRAVLQAIISAGNPEAGRSRTWLSQRQREPRSEPQPSMSWLIVDITTARRYLLARGITVTYRSR